MGVLDIFIDNNATIGGLTLKEIKKRGRVVIEAPIDNVTLSLIIKYLHAPTIVHLKPKKDLVYDELAYLESIANFFDLASKQKVDYVITIDVNNRELFRQKDIISHIPNNVVLTIHASDNDYSFKKYKVEERKIEEMIAYIRTANLSPLEKFLAVYDIVKNYKPYNDKIGAVDDSFLLNRILDDNNKYIVCAGYARLLEELLIRVGIPCKRISLDVDRSYKKGFTQEEKPLDYVFHTRNLVMLDDDKYNIHGIYVSDSTWDNHPNKNLYLNCLMTFDRKKEADRLEKLADEDLLLDFHDVDDFMKKIKYYFKKSTSRENNTNEMEEHLRCLAYKNLYLKIMGILLPLDHKKAEEIFRKYDSKLNIDTTSVVSQDLEKVLVDLLVEYAKYIMPLVNQKIDNKAIITALINVQKVIYYKSDKDIKDFIDDLTETNKLMEQTVFPYEYRNDMPEAYVESRYKK